VRILLAHNNGKRSAAMTVLPSEPLAPSAFFFIRAPCYAITALPVQSLSFAPFLIDPNQTQA
jgi:hypothetical protein